MPSLKLVLKVDATNTVLGDLFINPQGQVQLTTTLGEDVAQLLYTRFRMFQGEWFLNASLGLPWYQKILGIKGSRAVVENILRQVITTCPGVASLDYFVTTYSGRNLALTFRCTLTDATQLNSADYSAFVLAAA